jgi:putative Mn2+ efflux pump MntP
MLIFIGFLILACIGLGIIIEFLGSLVDHKQDEINRRMKF